MPKVLVIPTYQEAENIAALLREVRSVCPELDVVVADDNSPDGTGKIAEEVAEELGRIQVLHRPGKQGLGAAYRHGFRHALDQGYEVVVQMDADFSHDPAVLPVLLDAVDAGADVAVGSRYVPGGSVPNWTWMRRMLSRWGNTYARTMLRLRLRDATTAFRAYRAEVLEAIDIDGTTANGYLFQIETAFRLSVAGVRVVEVPITFVDRVAGSSKMAVVRTMAETELRVTWWGIALRAPHLTDRVRATGPGRFAESRIRPTGSPRNL
ncbi:polyprenol monophosphomannose synthase [Dermatobacter hominis]|uniref:polyprenol monophosphomannose synthase n=1 Tax=Dermatobacter hominis TaxID=2884263 RepID=UPI001D105D27|nr:polyprenol monophosphomannose synthase [Dermatobacter hominis]UDY36462.1 polyprenol monophosphomannose synthase [Dermatobacter hominis]